MYIKYMKHLKQKKTVTVKGRGESSVTVRLQAGITTPQGNGNHAKEVLSGNRKVRRTGTESNSTTNGLDGVKEVF